jgi:hypothetical protein
VPFKFAFANPCLRSQRGCRIWHYQHEAGRIHTCHSNWPIEEMK